MKEGETMAVKTAAAAPAADPLIPNGYKISKVAFASVLLVLDALLISLIIAYVPYTKIDWDAYMSQVSGFFQGERDYRNLKGDTGPLVYPAGFLYVYSAIQFVTGGEVYPAQILFGILYIINLGIILFICGMTTDEVIAAVPDILNHFSKIVKGIHRQGGMSFWIHNTAPIGCLPYVLER